MPIALTQDHDTSLSNGWQFVSNCCDLRDDRGRTEVEDVMEQVAVTRSYRKQRGHRLSHTGPTVARELDFDSRE